MIYLTRRATFSASHYYWNPAWDEERNRQTFGRCANRNGHGHNYTLEVTVEGEVDPVTGFVVDLKWLKAIIERQVLDAWDHRHLNLEAQEFAASELAATIPTTENIAIAAWKRLEPSIIEAGGARLSRVRVYETPEIFAEYRGPRERDFVRGEKFRGPDGQVFVRGVDFRGEA
jgi:6-pyruvoyltetrahydropterin/6-carboxytetrahydropterin synthase